MLGSAPVPVGCEDTSPRYTLFHAANSICSQKVRAVLAHHRCGYLSHGMDIVAGHTYLPSYVRLRLIGCERAGLSLATTHTGSTAASEFGCDPAVVPTLIDHLTNEVVVDSKAICRHVDSAFPDGERLRPAALAREIDAELDVIDGLPNYQMLVGRPGDDDRRPAGLRARDGAAFSMSKVARCDRHIAEHAGEADLAAAYGAKRSKELQAARNLFSEAAVRAAHAAVEQVCREFDARLPREGNDWLFGERVTMADLFWATALIRMENMGADRFWAGGKLPALEQYLRRARSLGSVRAAVLEWPGALWK